MKVVVGFAGALAALVSMASAAAIAGEQKQAEPAPAATPAPAAAQPAAAPPASAAGTGWSAEVAPGGTAGITLDPGQTATVNKVSQYFKDLTTMEGEFVQTNPDQKKMRGKFQVQKPGKFRFDYNRPSLQVIISDGEYLAIQDHDLQNEDRVALDQTPFRLLLRKEVDLVRDASIMEVQEADDLIVLSVADKSPDTPGKIKLFLAKQPAVELKEWVTTDAQGLETRVEVSNVVKGKPIDEAQFKIKAVTASPLTP
ncbi:MAG: outer membrane lipoprotein carrier protein LolA [Hyphomicrobium sp.]|nr:outer membrane lipoprotein carrier protein LolA [Hyphomicrobium sp.]